MTLSQWPLGLKARWKETTRKTKTLVVNNIKTDLVEVVWTGLVWLRIGTGGELL
jgi:hypothetical protein